MGVTRYRVDTQGTWRQMSRLAGTDVRKIVDAINTLGLGESVERNVYFETAGQEVAVPLSDPYVETSPVPADYAFKVVQGDRRAVIRKGSTTWTAEYAYFVSNTGGIYADIAILF